MFEPADVQGMIVMRKSVAWAIAGILTVTISGCSGQVNEEASVASQIAAFKSNPVPENCTWAGWSMKSSDKGAFPVCIHSASRVNADSNDDPYSSMVFGGYALTKREDGSWAEEPGLSRYDSFGNATSATYVKFGSRNTPGQSEWVESMEAALVK